MKNEKENMQQLSENLKYKIRVNEFVHDRLKRDSVAMNLRMNDVIDMYRHYHDAVRVEDDGEKITFQILTKHHDGDDIPGSLDWLQVIDCENEEKVNMIVERDVIVIPDEEIFLDLGNHSIWENGMCVFKREEPFIKKICSKDGFSRRDLLEEIYVGYMEVFKSFGDDYKKGLRFQWIEILEYVKKEKRLLVGIGS